MTDAARRSFWTICLLVLSVLPAWGQQSVPALTGRVVDQAGILSPATEAALTELLEAHEAETSNQLAVLTITSLEGEAIESFSLRVAETWALGTAANDNGVLLTVAVEDRELRIEVGDGLEGVLTDALAGRIIRNEIVPQFRAGDFEAGVLAGVGAIIGVIEGTYAPPEDIPVEDPPIWFGLIFLIVPSFFAFFAVFTPGCTRWFLFLFLIPFFGSAGFLLSGAEGWGFIAGVSVYTVLFFAISLHPKVRAIQEKMKEAQATGGNVKVGPFTVSPGSSSSGGSSWSSGGSSFSGGGGSFSGGGSSGSW